MQPDAKSARALLENIGAGIRSRYIENRMLLSFEEYLEVFRREPRRQARSAAQFARDAMDFYGSEEIRTPAGPLRRFALFDGGFEGNSAEAPTARLAVAGQEEVQTALYRHLSSFARAGRVNRLLLLHGPNGSAKSSILMALTRALEDYSRRPEGARYRFNWVFPSGKLVKGGIGFGETGGSGEQLASYAHLESENIDVRISCEMKDFPLLLIPRVERRRLLVESTRPSERGTDEGFVLSDAMLDGELCHKCRAIHQALLAHYSGDWLKVLRHVQVERFHVSRRYLTAAVTIEPQLSVDADFRQITVDRSQGALPAPLQNLVLYEPSGPLVNANRGLVDFSDLLKRPLEAYKYLLGTSETATVFVGPFLLQLDAVLLATSNEKHLSAFKEIPDFASFKGRIELIRVPYLRRRSVEKRIYDDRFNDASAGRHVAPHATRVVATFAVLTRLRKPLLERWASPLRGLLDELTPHEKLVLYDEGLPPDRLDHKDATRLRSALEDLFHETDGLANYEGRSGASAREMMAVLFGAAQNQAYRCLTPQAVLEELSALVRDPSVYEFLQQPPNDGYQNNESFVQAAERDYLEVLDAEVRDSMGLVSEAQYRELFERYAQHASAWLKGEKLSNRITGASEPPDVELLLQVERIIAPGTHDAREFRRSVISSVGAFRLDHPEADIDYSVIFSDHFRRLRDHYFDERKRMLRRNTEDVLRYLGNEREELDAKALRLVETMLGTMREKFGYCDHCAKDALVFLMRRRYTE